MDDDKIRAALHDVADQLVIDVDREWARLLAHLADEPARVHRRAVRADPRGRWTRRLAARVAVVILVSAVVSATLLLARATKPKAHSGSTTTTIVQGPFVYRPTGTIPPAFLGYAYTMSGKEMIAVFSTKGRLVRVLATDSDSLLYRAQDQNGVLVSPDRRQAFYLKGEVTGPPNDKIAIYRSSVAAGGRQSIVARGLDPTVSPDGHLLAIQTFNAMGYLFPIRPLFSVVDLANSVRANVIVSGLFRDRALAKDAVAGLAWLPGTHQLVALLEPYPNACSMVADPPILMKCPLQLQAFPTTIAVMQIGERAGVPFATGVRLVNAPAGYGWRLVEPGPVAGSITLIGDRGTTGPPHYRVFAIQLSPHPRPPHEIGWLPEGCVPFSFDATSGAVLCELVANSGATSVEIVRLGHSGPPLVVNLHDSWLLGNAAWIP
jgi:hypothetical protein